MNIFQMQNQTHYTVIIDINMIVNIKIQSISDIITNSSSEVFCTITGLDIEAIKEIITPLFPNQDSEMGPTAWYDEEDKCIQIDIPYGVEGLSEFFKAGLEAVLDKYLGGHYHIEYEY